MESLLTGYFQKRKQVDQTISEINGFIQKLSVSLKKKQDLLENLATIQRNFHETNNLNYPIVVLAGWNNGKSTFLNAIVGKELLPMKNKSYTSVVTRIRYAQQPKMTIMYSDNETVEHVMEDITVKDLEQYVTVEADEDRSIREVIIEYPFEACKGGIELIDTPGVNSINETHDRITEAVFPTTKTMIIMVKANHAGSRGDVEFLKKVLKGRNRDEFSTIFVINKCESMTTEEIEDAKETLSGVIALVKDDDDTPLIKNPQIISISSYFELKTKLFENRYIDFVDVIDDERLYFKDETGFQQPISNPEDLDKVKEIANVKTVRNALNEHFLSFSSTSSIFNKVYFELAQLIESINQYLENVLTVLTQDKKLQELQDSIKKKSNDIQVVKNDTENLKKEIKTKVEEQILEISKYAIPTQLKMVEKEVSTRIDKMEIVLSRKVFAQRLRDIIQEELEQANKRMYAKGNHGKVLVEQQFKNSYRSIFDKNAPIFERHIRMTKFEFYDHDKKFCMFLIRTLGQGLKGKIHSFIATYTPKNPFEIKTKMKHYLKQGVSKYSNLLANRFLHDQSKEVEVMLYQLQGFYLDALTVQYQIKMVELREELDALTTKKNQRDKERLQLIDSTKGNLSISKAMHQYVEKENEQWKQLSKKNKTQKSLSSTL